MSTNDAAVVTVFGEAMDDAPVSNNAAADAEVALVLAGRARWLHSMALGLPSESLLKNPQGLYGIDWSGPPYGPAVRHPIWIYSTAEASEFSANWDVSRLTLIKLPTVSSITSTIGDLVLSGRLWVKPFPSHVANTPYSKLSLSGLFKSTASATLTFRWDVTGVVTGLEHTASYTLAGGAVPEIKVDIGLVPVRPGWNDFSLTVSTDKDTSVEVLSLSLCQIEKLTH